MIRCGSTSISGGRATYHMSCPPHIRAELARNAESGRKRSTKFTTDRPTDWNPNIVKDPRDPEGKTYFTPTTAWYFIVELLQNGCEVIVVELDRPPGKTGYEIRVPGHPNIYIKLELAPPGVYGRSFHYSEFKY
jgi:hypothetical protein